MEVLFGFGLLTAFICGILSAWIASTKHRSGCAWFLVGLFLGPLGIIIAAVMGRPHTGWICPYCKEEVQKDALVCPHCQRDLIRASQSTSTSSPPPTPPPQSKVWIWILTALVALLVIGIAYSCVILATK